MDINIRRQDRSQTTAETGASSGDAVRSDTSASAALAEAVKSARETAKSVVQVSEVKAASRWSGASRFATQSVVALMLVGAGWSASYMGTLSNRGAIERLEDKTARSQEILARLSSDLASLKNTAAAFKEVELTSSITAKSEQTKLTDNIERLVISLQEPTRKLSSLEVRLDKMESQIMATLAVLSTKPAPSPAPAAPIAPPTPSVTEAAAREEAPATKPAKNEPVDGWVLREVYKGAALVESRNRRLYEVMPGGILPGVGKVESIERRGARWVVLTDKGFIGAYR